MNWFTGCKTIADIKTLYRQLAKANHPDLGGDTKTMQAINSAYHAALERMDGTTERGSDDRDHTYRYNAKQEQEIIDKLHELLRLRLPGCEIWLVGKWLWIQGDTKPVKDSLKTAGCIWHSKRGAWYWKPADLFSHYNNRADLADLASYYGAKVFAGQDTDKAMAAA